MDGRAHPTDISSVLTYYIDDSVCIGLCIMGVGKGGRGRPPPPPRSLEIGEVLPPPPTLDIPVPSLTFYNIYFDFKSRPHFTIASFAYVYVYPVIFTGQPLRGNAEGRINIYDVCVCISRDIHRLQLEINK